MLWLWQNGCDKERGGLEVRHLPELLNLEDCLTILTRKHLIKDLSPYNCTAPDCTDAFTLFSEKYRWIRHMKAEHEAESISQSQCCPLCLVNTHDEKEDFLSHLSTHLEEISVAALPRGAFDDSDSDEESRKDANSTRLPSRNETAKKSANNLLAFWGYMFEPDKTPTRLFNALNHAMATHIVRKLYPMLILSNQCLRCIKSAIRMFHGLRLKRWPVSTKLWVAITIVRREMTSLLYFTVLTSESASRI